MLQKQALHAIFVFLILFLNYSDRYATAAVEPVVHMASPSQPVPLSPSNGATNVALTTTLSARVTDPESETLAVSFYGRRKSNTPGPNFTLAVIPDTQNYTFMQGGAAYFNAQTQWIVDHQTSNNIVFATHVGDITENGDYNDDLTQWEIADDAISILERNTTDPADDVPYSLSLGNHDTTHYFNYFDRYFGPARYEGRPYYGGRYDTTNHNTYSYFSAAGMKFIVINLKYYEINEEQPTYPAEILEWADDLLKDDLSRRGIVVLHDMIDFVDEDGLGTFSTAGQNAYDALKDNPNLFVMLCGHYVEGRRTDLGTDGHAIHTLMSDYQDLINGGDGWMRLMEFQPEANQIQVKTFSPTRNAGAGDYQTDDDSQFTLPYQMLSPDFTLLETVSVASGATASIAWSELWDNTEYEWFAAARDASGITVGPVQSFTTINIPNRPPVLAPIGTREVQMPKQLSFTASATDADVPPDPLTYSLNSCGVSGASINPTTGVFTWKPVVGQHSLGEYQCPVCVSDGTGDPAVCENVRIKLLGTVFIPSVRK